MKGELDVAGCGYHTEIRKGNEEREKERDFKGGEEREEERDLNLEGSLLYIYFFYLIWEIMKVTFTNYGLFYLPLLIKYSYRKPNSEEWLSFFKIKT